MRSCITRLECLISEKSIFELDLLPNEPIESFWDALWLGIQPFLCFYGAKLNSAKLNLLPKEPVESFWGGMWRGIRPFLCFSFEKSIP